MLTDSQKYKVEFFKSKFKQNLKCNEEKSKIVDGMFQTLVNLYLYFKDEVPYVSVKDDNYPYYMITPSNGEYELLDYLLNKMIQNVELISTYVTGNQYELGHKTLGICLNRYDNVTNIYTPMEIQLLKNKSITHETIHALSSASFLQRGKDYVKRASITDEEAIRNYNKKRDEYFSSNKNQIVENEIKVFWGGLSDEIPGGRIYVEVFTEALAVTLSHLREYAEMKLYGDSDDISKFVTFFSNNDFIFTPNKENGYKYASNYFYLILQLVSKKSIFETMFLGKDTLVNEINSLDDNLDLFNYLDEKMWNLIEYQDDVELIKNEMIELSKIIIKIYSRKNKLNELNYDYFINCDEVYEIVNSYLNNKSK